MALDQHTISVPSGSQPNYQDRAVLGEQFGVANAAGAAGATVSTAVTFGNELPPNYAVLVDTGQDAYAWVTAKTSNGFTVNMAPVLSTNSVAAGTFNVVVVG